MNLISLSPEFLTAFSCSNNVFGATDGRVFPFTAFSAWTERRYKANFVVAIVYGICTSGMRPGPCKEAILGFVCGCRKELCGCSSTRKYIWKEKIHTIFVMIVIRKDLGFPKTKTYTPEYFLTTVGRDEV